jgi:hypothetical protein
VDYHAMNTRRRIVNLDRFSLIGFILLACQFAGGQELPKNRTDLLNLSLHNQDMLLHDLGPVLKATGGGGRLYVHSNCLGDSEDLFFPRIEVKSGSNGKAGLAAIRDIFAKSKDVTVAERQSGLIGIRIGDISNDLLGTRIHVLKFGPRQRYNYQDAIVAIISTKEVQTKMRELRMEVAPRFVHYPILYPNPKLRHLPASMTDLTMDEALDRVAQAFGGLIIYEECVGQNPIRLFSVHMHEM